MFGFTIKVVICDYKNQKMIYEVLHLETKDTIFDKYLIKLKKPNSKYSYPMILTDSKKIEIDEQSFKKKYKIYFDRDDIINPKKRKSKEAFYSKVFKELYMEINEDNVNEYSKLKINDKHFQQKSINIVSQFTIDLNIHIKDSIQSKLQYLQ
jgi:hypothetical protein